MQTQKKLVHVLPIFLTFFVGLVIGITIDKDWLSDQQIDYVNSLKSENQLLQEQNKQWLAFIEDEMKQMNVFITSDYGEDHGLYPILKQIGVEAEKIYKPETVLNNKGILITLGDELDFPNDIPHISLDMIPEKESDINKFYVSLLRVKENLQKNE